MNAKTQEIRNSDRHLVGKFDPATATILIERKGCLTTIRLLPDGNIEITNMRIGA